MIGITGAKGVLGRIICQKLENRNVDFSIFNGNIRNENAVFEWLKSNDVSYIIHLASKVAVSDVENNIAEAYEVNVSGTINLIKAIGIMVYNTLTRKRTKGSTELVTAE